jgi:hypothetical protein
MKRRIRVLAGLWAVLLSLGLAASAFGYTGQVPGSITIAVQGSSACGDPLTVNATLLDTAGKPVTDQSVAWKLTETLSSSDKVNKTPTITNSNGVATTTVTLGCVNGSRPLRATAGELSAQVVLTVSTGGLPNTSTVPAEASGTPATLAFALLAGVVLALGGAWTLRRAVATSR